MDFVFHAKFIHISVWIIYSRMRNQQFKRILYISDAFVCQNFGTSSLFVRDIWFVNLLLIFDMNSMDKSKLTNRNKMEWELCTIYVFLFRHW